MPEKARRSVLGLVQQPALTNDEKAKKNKRRLRSKLQNSMKRAWRATNELLEPVWKGKGIQ
jgi:hypothetical protein